MTAATAEAGLIAEYRYEVFISYPRRLYAQSEDDIEHSSGPWLRDVFLEQFKSYLADNWNSSPRVFHDSDIPAGQDWLAVIRDALRTSRCLVPIWSAPYFRSRYCLWEWASFRNRGAGLIIPIGWTARKDLLPDEAKTIQISDFSEFAFPNPALTRVEEGLPFLRAVRDFAKVVADSLALAPAFDPNDPKFIVPELPPAPAKPKIGLPRLR